MKKRAVIITLILLLNINLISAGLCKGIDGYYHDCEDVYYPHYNYYSQNYYKPFYYNYKTYSKDYYYKNNCKINNYYKPKIISYYYEKPPIIYIS